jgi:DNA-binding NtrC family response regulator
VLTLAAALDVDLYLEAMQLGAFDCAGLPLDRKELARLIGRAAEARFQAMAS